MERIIYTTCGTSLLTHSNCWQGISNKQAASSIKDINDREEQEKYLRKWVYEHKRELAGCFDRNSWNDVSKLRQLPAELASLRAIQLFCEKTTTPIPLNGGDRVILVYADNLEGAFCANTIQNILTEQKLLGPVGIGQPWKVEGLDFNDKNRFPGAIKHFWTKLTERMHKFSGISYLNLTGGYKSLIMLFTCAAYVKGIGDTWIFYLNEESEDEILIVSFDKNMKLHAEYSSINTGYFDTTSGKSYFPQKQF